MDTQRVAVAEAMAPPLPLTQALIHPLTVTNLTLVPHTRPCRVVRAWAVMDTIMGLET